MWCGVGFGGLGRCSAQRELRPPKGRGLGCGAGFIGLGGVRLSRSFALPRGEAWRAVRDSVGLGGVRLSGSFALPKGAAGLAECTGDDFPAFGDTGQSFLSSEVFEVEVIGLQSEGGEECGVEVFDGLG